MKKRLLHIAVSVLLGALMTLLSSCEMGLLTDSYQVVADGAALPAKYAIASGNPDLMRECLDHNLGRLDDPGLSAEQKGRIALDAIDLLAVLSDAVEKLIPYLSGDEDPGLINDINDIYSSESEQFLAKITQYELIYHALGADPSPLQHLWGTLGLGAYLYTYNGNDWAGVYSDLSLRSNLPPSVSTVFDDWITRTDGAAPGNLDYQVLITKIHEVTTEP